MKMKKRATSTLLSIVAVACFFHGAWADIDEFGRFQIAEEPTTPRISAMGGAGTALSGGGFGLYNPASPAFATAPFLSLEYGTLPGDPSGDLSKWKIESAWMFRKWFAGASLAVHSTDFQTTTPEGWLGNMSSFQAIQATLNGGFIIGRFACGHSFNFLQERNGDETYQVLTYSPGILFQLVPNKIALGASLLHYVRLDTSLARFAWFGGAIGLPRYVRAGVSWTDTLHRASLPFTAALDVVYSEVYKRLMVPVGLEVWVLPSLAARAGVRLNDQSTIAHFGVGVRSDFIAFDFDYGITRPVQGASIEQKWLLGLTLSLPGI